jgi:hypothetical protein
MEKMTYVAPTLEEIGSFEEITRSTNTGFSLDAAYSGGRNVAGQLSN